MYLINEPIPDQRSVPVYLADSLGNGVSGQVGLVTIKVSKNGGTTWTTPDGATALVEITGSSIAGAYRLNFGPGDFDTEGMLLYAIIRTGVIRDFVDGILVEPLRDALWYGKAAGGATGSVTLGASASTEDSYYASSTSPATVVILAGKGVGQSRLASGYVGGTKQLAVTPNWTAGDEPDATSVVKLLPIAGGVSSGGGGGGTVVIDNAAIASAVMNYITDPQAPATLQTVKHILNVLASWLASNATGFPFEVQQQLNFPSLGDPEKTRLAGAISNGQRKIATADGT